MRTLQTLLTLFGAMALLALGAVGATASPAHAAPCHAASGPTAPNLVASGHAMAGYTTSQPDRGDQKHPQTPKGAMNCCAFCVTPPIGVDLPMAAPASAEAVLLVAPASSLIGLVPSPAQEPPKA